MAATRQQSGQVPARQQVGEVALYRFFDRDDRLLYVGIAEEPIQRWYAHSTRSWWQDVASFEVMWYPDRQEADRAERQAIVEGRPMHNVVFNRANGAIPQQGSPTLKAIILRSFKGRHFTVNEVAKETGFSTTSAQTSLRALAAAGDIQLIGAPKWSEARVYSVAEHGSFRENGPHD